MYSNCNLGKLRVMSEVDRIIEYNKTIKHMPQPSDFSIIEAAKKYYNIDVDMDDKVKLQEIRNWIYDSKHPKDGPASIDIAKIIRKSSP